MDVVSLLIKPASGQCNSSCQYCFYDDLLKEKIKPVHSLMSTTTLEAVIKKGMSLAKRCLILSFQGGEPLLAGLDYFNNVIKLVNMQKSNLEVKYAIQTNGLLLDEKWCSFLKNNHFLVGLSLDGPQEVHNKNRQNFNQVFSKIKLLKQYHIEFSILSVVTKNNYFDIKKTYTFFKENDLRFLQFIPCLPLYNEKLNDKFTLNNEEYFWFLDNLFTLWSKDIVSKEPISIRYFDNLVGLLLNIPTNLCDLNNGCGNTLVIEANGDVYPCDFYVEKKYLLGNINDSPLQEIYNNPLLAQFKKQAQAALECKTCLYYFLCYGGCQRYRNNSYVYCKAIKKFLNKKKADLNKIHQYFLNTNAN